MVCMIVFVMVSGEANALLTWHARLLDDCGVGCQYVLRIRSFISRSFFEGRLVLLSNILKKSNFTPLGAFIAPIRALRLAASCRSNPSFGALPYTTTSLSMVGRSNTVSVSSLLFISRRMYPYEANASDLKVAGKMHVPV